MLAVKTEAEREFVEKSLPVKLRDPAVLLKEQLAQVVWEPAPETPRPKKVKKYLNPEDDMREAIINTDHTIFRYVSRAQKNFENEWNLINFNNISREGEVHETYCTAKLIAINGQIRQIKARHWSCIITAEVPSDDKEPEMPAVNIEKWVRIERE